MLFRSASYEEGLRNIEIGTADIVMEIPRHLERDWMNGEDAHVLIAANAVNGTKGGLGSSYLSSIINDYAAELRSEHPEAATVSGAFPSIQVDTQGLFNPNLNYKLYMIPALMVMLLTLICGFLPALNVVSEKEVGTIEQINVTPVPKFVFILAKLLPYWLIGFLVLTVCFILAWLIYGIVPVGHFLLIYFFAVLFVLVMSSLGHWTHRQGQVPRDSIGPQGALWRPFPRLLCRGQPGQQLERLYPLPLCQG